MKRRSSTASWMLLGLATYAAAAVAGVQTVRQANEMRTLFQRHADNQRTQDRHLREYRLLLLERQTFAGYQHVERIAEDELGMRFPDAVVQVAR